MLLHTCSYIYARDKKKTQQDMSLLETTTASANEVSGLLACATTDGDLLAWELVVRTPAGVDAPSAETVMISTSDSAVLSVEGGGAQRWSFRCC